MLANFFFPQAELEFGEVGGLGADFFENHFASGVVVVTTVAEVDFLELGHLGERGEVLDPTDVFQNQDFELGNLAEKIEILNEMRYGELAQTGPVAEALKVSEGIKRNQMRRQVERGGRVSAVDTAGDLQRVVVEEEDFPARQGLGAKGPIGSGKKSGGNGTIEEVGF